MGEIRQGRIGVPPFCLLLKTGQTTQYSSEKDDGYYEKGLSRQYVILTTGQFSGAEDVVLNAKTHNLSNNCVIDKRTGLMWVRYVPDGDIGPDNEGTLYWKEGADAENIFRFKAKVKAAKIGGYSDWRIPNFFELLTLLDFSTADPCIDETTFPDVLSKPHWSSTTVPNATTYAYYVDFDRGYCAGSLKGSGKNYCRLVRGPLGGEI